MGVREGKNKGGGKKFARLFRIVPEGGGGRSDYEKLILDSIFPTKLTEFATKLTEFVPFIFTISQYCRL